MDLNRILRFFLFIVLVFSLPSCAWMMENIEKVADPYSKKLKCPAGEGYDCLDVEKTYKKDEQAAKAASTPFDSAFAGEPTELTIGKPLSETFEQIIDDSFKVESTDIGLADSQIDATVEKEMRQIAQGTAKSGGSATDRLVEYIRTKRFFPDVEAKILKSIAEDYSTCVKETEDNNRKKLKEAKDGFLKFTEEDAIAKLRNCTVFLKNVPGLVAFRSNSISEQLKIMRETDTRKYISKTVTAGNLPIRVPPKTVQIRICAYPDDQDIYVKDHHLFTILGEGKWLIERTGTERNKNVRPLQ